jgi:hypothetical protein
MDTITFGPWAVIVPSDVTDPPMSGFDAKAFPIFVPTEQTQGVAIGPIDKTAPASQIRMPDRLAHLIWRVQDRTLPPVAIVGLGNPDAPLQDAIADAGAGALDLTVVPLLCVPLWALSVKERNTIAGKLPVYP